jgi:hypothetical protein
MNFMENIASASKNDNLQKGDTAGSKTKFRSKIAENRWS